ncbi:MAG: TVP38/TMEM64 family protein [Clostridia bacterium]|nr:TVP38/TMEM64 family protein [Clostridia bacterium]
MHRADKKIWLKFAGTLLLVLAGVLCCLLAVMQIEELNRWYETWQQQLVMLEERVAAMGNKGLIVLMVMLLFTLKSVFPPITIPAICLISGMVLPWYFALIVNIAGVAWLMTIRYFWGWKLGCGGAIRLVRQSEIVNSLLERKGTGNPYLLFVFRLIPAFPVNSISRLYGAMHFRYRDYIFISLGGFMFKILSYTIIGRNVFNPLSASFLLPIIMFSFFSGCVLIGLHYVLDSLPRNSKNDKKG